MTGPTHFEAKAETRRKRLYGLAVEKRMVKRGSSRAHAVAAVAKGIKRRAVLVGKDHGSPSP